MADVIVKKSKIHGLGVFAAQNFKKGEIVSKWNTSPKLTTNKINNLPAEEKIYVSFHNGEYILIQPPSRYINHSCAANTYTDNFCDIEICWII